MPDLPIDHAEVTHSHLDAQAGAIAIAVAAAYWAGEVELRSTTPTHFLETVIEKTPDSDIKSRIEWKHLPQL
ncbi:MAG: hypothetical protein F6K19_21035 [Cyanothece sp. SIO1E1]|nr:hypothetical protein [Cyanothece sp. SIO1E1]